MCVHRDEALRSSDAMGYNETSAGVPVNREVAVPPPTARTALPREDEVNGGSEHEHRVPVVSDSLGIAILGANGVSAGGLVVGHELPKLIARVQLPAGAYFCEYRREQKRRYAGVEQGV
jgi:hypothetical protein